MILWRSFGSLSIRHKLLALGLLPLLLALPLLAVILIVWGDSALDALLVTKVRSDLAVAHGYFERLQAEVGAGTFAVAQSHALVDTLQRADRTELARLLAHAKLQYALEFLELLPPSEVAVAARDAAGGDGIGRMVLLEGTQFERIAPDLAGRVPVKLVPTRNAAPTERTSEDRAMVMLALAPVRTLRMEKRPGQTSSSGVNAFIQRSRAESSRGRSLKPSVSRLKNCGGRSGIIPSRI